jgi:hypothetical protein
MPDTLHLTLEHLMPDSMEIIYENLLDFELFGKLHPYIKTVKKLQNNNHHVEYDIREQVRVLGFIKIYPKYKAKVFEIEKHKHIRYESQVKKNIFLRIDFKISKNKNEAVVIKEEVTIQSGKLVGKYFLNILKKAHLQFFRNLTRHIQLTVIRK